MQDPEFLERMRELQALDAMIAAACRGAGRLVAVDAVLFDQVDATAGGEDIWFALLHGLFN